MFNYNNDVIFHPPMEAEAHRKPQVLTATGAVETNTTKFPVDRRVTLFNGAQPIWVKFAATAGLANVVSPTDGIPLGPYQQVSFLTKTAACVVYVEGVTGSTDPYSVAVYVTGF